MAVRFAAMVMGGRARFIFPCLFFSLQDRYIERELELLEACSVHPNVVGLHGVIRTSARYLYCALFSVGRTPYTSICMHCLLPPHIVTAGGSGPWRRLAAAAPTLVSCLVVSSQFHALPRRAGRAFLQRCACQNKGDFFHLQIASILLPLLLPPLLPYVAWLIGCTC